MSGMKKFFISVNRVWRVWKWHLGDDSDESRGIAIFCSTIVKWFLPNRFYPYVKYPNKKLDFEPGF